ncbi:carbohydrate ABC transporter membrane protein 1, CUT1 family (TC 3.A.1.1.-) [Paenibacillus uliginis N3/975]|uniref:Carbohydrate ABC transporter membrane protein 1, CUT1 family (TC 3.A.1.1.-) n=1 Tax=Paenibacillus uliginis N3/975 TaxID=1313296 RepID=A0A1X7HSV4_9BACL|nr:ABC transporter permease subunit [Paenibacillus uliginis]SMF91718.1 carbohydrate ABC transporter membrane protein 1, CUT1 family (TC 3.A.1.1.-) [Paenibacillus uliginis N3/975]
MARAGIETSKARPPKKAGAGRKLTAFQHMKRDRQLLILFIPCFLFYLIFRYGPLYGMLIAFKDYSVFTGIMESPWVGLKHFTNFFTGPDFWLLFKNTLTLGVLTLIFSFPFPIILAILLNEVRLKWFKKSVQTISYLPSFLSVVIISSMLIDFLSPNNGIINQLLALIGFEKTYFLIDPAWFRPVYIASDIWTNTGYEAIVYMAAIAGISPSLYEAAKVDGAKRRHMIFKITIPALMPTIIIMFILKTGQMLRIGYEKVLLLYNPMTYEVADVFSTFVYRKGILEANYSYAAAVGLFEAVVAMVLLFSSNFLSKKIGGNGLW